MKKLVAFLTAVILCCCMSVCPAALDIRSDIPTKTLNRILDDYRAALKSGESYVSLADYGVSGNDAYSDLYSLFLFINGDIGSITISNYSETIVNTMLDTDTSGAIKGARLIYNDRYLTDGGKCDIDLLNEDRRLVEERYQYARSLVKYGMSDAEKALVLYEFIISAADYPTDEEINSGGNDIYTFVGLLRDEKAVCAAYAKLYAILLNDSGIPAVTVESDSIDHEWVMLRIDGKWYHADPTWDDYTFEDGYTVMWDLNNDTRDIGAAYLSNFLKSDEEIVKTEHPDWELSNSVNPLKLKAVPTSGQSGAFSDKFFSSDDPDILCYSKMNYINGNWYFVDIYSNAIIRATYSGDREIINLPDSDFPKYSFGYENELYICTDKTIYRYDTISEKFSKVMEIPEEKHETDCFSEMRILYDKMTLVSASYTYDDSNEYKSAVFTENEYPMSDISAMEGVIALTDDDEPEAQNIDGTAVTANTRSSRLGRPGGNTASDQLTVEQRAALDASSTTGRRLSAIFLIVVSAVFIGLAILAVINALRNIRK